MISASFGSLVEECYFAYAELRDLYLTTFRENPMAESEAEAPKVDVFVRIRFVF